MILLKWLALFSFGSFLACLTSVYLVERRNDFESLEIITIAILVITVKNYLLRILGAYYYLDIDTSINACIGFLAFGFGFTSILYFLTSRDGADSSMAKDNQAGTTEQITISKEAESTSTIVLSCLFLITSLLVLAITTYLINI